MQLINTNKTNNLFFIFRLLLNIISSSVSNSQEWSHWIRSPYLPSKKRQHTQRPQMKQKLEQKSQYGSYQGTRQPQHKATGCHQLHISAADSPFYCRCQEKQRWNKPQQTFRLSVHKEEGGDTSAHPVRNLPPLQIHKGGGQQQKEKQNSLHPTSAGRAVPPPVPAPPSGEHLSAGPQTVPAPAGRLITLHCEAVP